MPDDIIDFKAVRDRRIEAYWQNIRTQLEAIMADADSDDAAMTTATLYALLSMLEAGSDMTWNAAKAFVAASLKQVWEE